MGKCRKYGGTAAWERNAMNWIWVILVLVAAGGAGYIHVVNKVGKLDVAARDAGSEVDGLIWDRNHQLSEMIRKLKDKKIDSDIMPAKSELLMIGMVAPLQMELCKELDEKAAELEEVLTAHPELQEDTDFQLNYEKFTEARTRLIPATMKYNRTAAVFNGYISGFPASFVAGRRNKTEKSFFNYIFQDLKEKSSGDGNADSGH